MDKLYSVFDTKVGSYGPVIQHKNSVAAMRWFTDVVSGRYGDGDISRHPEDYTLIETGEVDLDTGAVSGQAKVTLCSGADVKTKELN